MFCSMLRYCKEKFDLIMFQLQSQKPTIKMQKMSKMTIFTHFSPIFKILKLDHRKFRKIAKFPAEDLSFIYFYRKMFQRVIYHLQSLKFKRECKRTFHIFCTNFQAHQTEKKYLKFAFLVFFKFLLPFLMPKGK